jgi:HlyD family secretion protein
MDGIVTSHREPGATVGPGAPVHADEPGRSWVRIYVPENRIGQVRLGAKATITSDSFAGKTYGGEVVFIASAAEFTPKTVQTKKERTRLVYRVKVEVPNPSLELKPGMPADARIVL